MWWPRAAALARGARRARRDGVGGGGPLERHRGPRRARGPPVGASRPDTARPRGRARPARDPERGTVRVSGADRGRAGVRAQRDPRPRYSRALRPLGAGASPVYFGSARRVSRRLACAAAPQASCRAGSALRRDRPPARCLSLAGRLAAAAGAARLVAAGAGLGLALLDLVAGTAAAVPGGHVVMVAGWQAAALWAGVALVAWWLWRSPRRPWLIAARVAFVTTLLVATTFRDVVSLDACRCLTVHFLDVGQGDAAVLRTPNGRWIVIDAGPRTPESDAGRRVVVPFLRRQGAGRLALAVATHGDADHLGGMPAELETFDPERVRAPGEPRGRPPHLEFLA